MGPGWLRSAGRIKHGLRTGARGGSKRRCQGGRMSGARSGGGVCQLRDQVHDHGQGMAAGSIEWRQGGIGDACQLIISS